MAGSRDSPIAPPDAALFPARTERQRIEDYLTRALALADQRVCAGAATPTLDTKTFRRELERFDFATPRSLSSSTGRSACWSTG